MSSSAELDASIRHAVDMLKLIDPTLMRAAVKPLKVAANIVATDARSRIPDVPTGVAPSGRPRWGKWGGSSDKSWDTGKARSGIKVQFRASRKNSEMQRPLVSIVETNPAGAVADMAGSSGSATKGAQGLAFNARLGGNRSRYMWPAMESKMTDVDAALEVAVREMESTINARLGGFSGLAGI